MARSDYAHWNEEADHMWWQEEGRFGGDDGYYADGAYLDDDPGYYDPPEPTDVDDCIAQGWHGDCSTGGICDYCGESIK